MAGPSGQNLKLIMTTTLDPAAKEEPQKNCGKQSRKSKHCGPASHCNSQGKKRMDIGDCYLMQPEWLTSVPQIGKEKVKDKLFFFFKQFVRDL